MVAYLDILSQDIHQKLGCGSIRRNANDYKQMIKQKDAILKNQKQMLYKRYRNKIVDLLKITKEAYENYFPENRKHSPALWRSGINEIKYSKKNSKAIPPSSIAVEGKTISDPQNIAENFKNFYQHWQKYLKKSSQLKNIFLSLIKKLTDINRCLTFN